MKGQLRQSQPAEQQAAGLRTAHLKVGLRSDRGPSRDLNEDYAEYVIPTDEAQLRSKGAIFVVADGMGGYLAGEVASKEAVRKVIKEYYADRSDDPGKSLRRAVVAANKVVHQQASGDPAKSGMGTTLVAAAVIGPRVYIANVGDSRAYGIGR
ncbi:MAG: protein phosphatase 2C domain-containing protein, partial [Anaerolineae bacterium]